jgi:CxxC-x17-CxxC domain-containing protein
MRYTDQTLTCRTCGEQFLFSAHEKAYFADHGLVNAPKRCPRCRATRTSESTVPANPRNEPPSKMHGVRCARCGRALLVPFVPRGATSVTCDDCFSRASMPAVHASPHRRWTNDAMLAVLRSLQAERGGYLRTDDLNRRQLPGVPARPSLSQVKARLGSWRAVCALLGQPYRLGNVKGVPLPASRQWTDEMILAALSELRERCGGHLRTRDLDLGRGGHQGRAGRYPTWITVVTHFGTWAQMLARLDDPLEAPESSEPVLCDINLASEWLVEVEARH